MRVLVVGGAGYLGGPTVEVAVAAGHEVTVYDALLYTDLYLRDVAFVRGSVTDEDALRPMLLRADAVIWLAALVGDVVCEARQDEAEAVNVEAVRWLADNFNGRVVFPSTCSIYGGRGELVDEDGPVDPLSVYGRTKLQAEKDLEGADAVIFRLGTLFGVGGRHERFRMDLVVNRMAVQAVRAGRIVVLGGDQWRPLLHVRDAGRAMVAGLAGPAGIYNLVVQNMRIRELAALLTVEVPGTVVEWRDGPADTDQRNYQVRADRAKKRLGFEPLITVRSGIKEVTALARAGRLSNPDSPRFDNRAMQRTTWGR